MNRRRPPRRNAGVVVACAFAAASGGGFWLLVEHLQHTPTPSLPSLPSPAPGVRSLQVSSSSTAHSVALDLRGFAEAWSDLSNNSRDVEVGFVAGVYRVSPQMTPAEVFAGLRQGQQPEHRFTVPEGLRKEEISRIIADAGFGDFDAICSLMASPELADEFGVPREVPGGIEGYLFPDTYQFPADTDALFVLRRMRSRLDEVVDEDLRTQMKEMNWGLHQTLTLAAIIEKEAAASDERAHISAVFHNRLAKGMRLQTDPTVTYGVADFSGSIKKSDLTRRHPYNTYVIAGLPPGPIASPGRAAIAAALAPDDADDLYFVAKGDSGRHEFCADLDCHNAAVQRWQR